MMGTRCFGTFQTAFGERVLGCPYDHRVQNDRTRRDMFEPLMGGQDDRMNFWGGSAAEEKETDDTPPGNSSRPSRLPMN